MRKSPSRRGLHAASTSLKFMWLPCDGVTRIVGESLTAGGAGLNDASGRAHQRRTRSPIAAPSMAMNPAAMTYQVATKSGLSSGQCVA